MSKKQKYYKCIYCKQLIENEDELVQFETGDKNKIIKRAHIKCREKVLERKKFFELFLSVLDVPSIDKKTVLLIDSYNKKGYDWQMMSHALIAKKQPIVDNFTDKGIPYIIAIFTNQLPVSYKIIQKQRENQRKSNIIKEKINKLQLEEDKIITVNNNKQHKDSEVIKCEDISDL